ncbi:MAG: hypothetical protein ABEL76_12310, partial [Bradymonadaceae bacterium]
AKYDQNGNQQWRTSSFGSADDVTVHDIAAEESTVYVAGGDRSSTGVGSAVLATFDPSGNRQSVDVRDPSGGEDSLTSLAVANQSDAVFAGGTASIASQGATYGLLWQYDSDGNRQSDWKVETDGGPKVVGSAVSARPSGGAVFFGHTDGSIDGSENRGEGDGIAVAHDASGSIQWVESFGTPEQDVIDDAIRIDGDWYVIGETEGALGDRDADDDGFSFVGRLL